MQITTSLNGPFSNEHLAHSLEQYRFGRYLEDRSLPVEAAKRITRSNLESLMARDATEWLTASLDDSGGMAFMTFRFSEWDTSHFGYPCAFIDNILVDPCAREEHLGLLGRLLQEFVEWCHARKIRFVFTRVPSLDLPSIQCLEDAGFRFIENAIVNVYDLTRASTASEPLGLALRFSKRRDLELMLEYSEGAFTTHHFHADPEVDRDKAESLYRKWIRAAFDDPNQLIAVLETEGRPRAFMIYYLLNLSEFGGRRHAMWKMALLDPKSRGQGLGTTFFASLIEHHRKEGLEVIDSGLTLRNLASMNLHIKHGFKIICTTATFHRWFS